MSGLNKPCQYFEQVYSQHDFDGLIDFNDCHLDPYTVCIACIHKPELYGKGKESQERYGHEIVHPAP